MDKPLSCADLVKLSSIIQHWKHGYPLKIISHNSKNLPDRQGGLNHYFVTGTTEPPHLSMMKS